MGYPSRRPQLLARRLSSAVPTRRPGRAPRGLGATLLPLLAAALLLGGCPAEETEPALDSGSAQDLDAERDRGRGGQDGADDGSDDPGGGDGGGRDASGDGPSDGGGGDRGVDDGGGDAEVVDDGGVDQPDGAPDGVDDATDGGDAGDGGERCVDGDGDGRGEGCAAGPDCDDDDPWTYPGAPQRCDGNDNTCGDEGVPADELDGDGDDFVVCLGWSDVQGDDEEVLGGGDCDDEDDGSFPGSAECAPSYLFGESFEDDDGGWRASGSLSSWEYGEPAGEVIDRAGRGRRAWVTNLDGPYNDDERSYLTSPRLDFGSLTSDPVLRFQHVRQLESFDGVRMEISLDDGESWERLGAFDEGTGWYNDRFDQWWSDDSDGWVVSERALTGAAGGRAVRLRLALDADSSNSREGFGFDDVSIFGGVVDATVELIDLSSEGCGRRAENQVVATVRNVGTEAFTGGRLELLLDDAVVASEDFVDELVRGRAVVFPFAATVDLSDGEPHEIGVRVVVAGDSNAANDVSTVSSEDLPGFTGLPYLEDFEAGPGGWFAYGTSSSWARGVPSGTIIRDAGEGEYAWVTNPAGPYNNGEFSYLESPCLDLSEFGGGDPMLTFLQSYSTESCCDEGWVEVSTNGGASWSKLVSNASAVNWYNNTSSQYWNGTSSGWRRASIRVPGVGGRGDVRLRFVFSSDGSVVNDGFAVDAVEVRGVTSGGLTALDVPDAGCNLGVAESVVATVLNDGTEPIEGASIRLQVDGAVLATETLPTIAGGATLVHTFGVTADLSAPGNHSVAASLIVPGDESEGNDALTRTVVSFAATRVAPYSTGFEAGADGWNTSGTNRTWALGQPRGVIIDEAAEGRNAWVTNLSGSYANSERSYLDSPCLDVSGIARDPLVTFSHVFETEACCDHGWLEYSLDRGASWSKVPTAPDASGWYNDTANQRWNGSSSGWRRARARLPDAGGRGAVLLRFAFQSDGSGTREGFGVDDVTVGALEEDDLAIEEIEVSSGTCHPGSAETVTALLANRGTRTAPGGRIALIVDGVEIAREVVVAELAVGEVLPVALARTVDLSAPGEHVVAARAIGLGDDVAENDEASVTVYNYAGRTALPSFEGFESDAGGWRSGGTNSSWERAIPADGVIASAGSGRFAWVTDADASYRSNEESWVESACYDLRGETADPFVSFAQIVATESCCDEAWLEMALDGGAWERVEAGDGALNWYTESSDGWAGLSGGWRTARTVLEGAAGHTMRLRMRFHSDGSVFNDGVAFDDVIVAQGDFMDVGVEVVRALWDGCGPTPDTRVEVTLRNRGAADAEGVGLTLRINGDVAAAETVPGTLEAGGEAVFVFPEPVDLSANGTYALEVEVAFAGDEIASNNVARDVVLNYGGADGLPYLSGFEADGGGWLAGGTNSSWARGIPSDSNIRNAGAGEYAWVTNPTGDHNVNENSFLYSPCFDLSEETADLRVSFLHNYYTESCCDEGWLDATVDGGETWARVVASTDAQNWYNDTANRWWDGTSSGWRTASVVVPGVAGASRVQLRFGFSSDGSSQNDGFGVDDVSIRLDEDPDLGLSNLTLAAQRCSYEADEVVSVTVNNEGNTAFERASLRLLVDDEVVATESFVPPAVGTSYRHTFAARADLFAAGEHTVRVELIAEDDLTVENDVVELSVVSNGGLTALPYLESFEEGEAGWVASGTNSSWARGMPTGALIDAAADGDWAWVTNPEGPYANGERSTLESPCFDFLDEVGDAVIRFDYRIESETCCDHAWMEVSLDGGRSWARVAGGESAVNWYNDTPNQWWEGSSGAWLPAATRLSGVGGRGDVRFRYVFESDTSEAREGFAMDRFRVEVD
jgi:hypothetical protein